MQTWEKTPLIYSEGLSDKLGCNIYLKLEHLHSSHSFKQRTLGLLAHEYVKRFGPSVHLVIPSGGNAALSAAHAAQQLGVACTVFVPIPSCKSSMMDALRRFGATPNAYGETYKEAEEQAEAFVSRTPNAVMLSPFDHPTLWQGSSAIIDEIAEQLGHNAPPDAIVCSVGGGSLLGGIMLGCDRHNWNSTRLIAVETTGSDSMYHSVLANDTPGHVVPSSVVLSEDAEHGIKQAILIPRSRATSLGASWSAPAVIKKACARRAQDRKLVTCVQIPDELAMLACLNFADEHKTMVELAAGATLSVAYSMDLFSKIFPDVPSEKRRPIVFVVCGGFKITLADLNLYQSHLEARRAEEFLMWIDECHFKTRVEDTPQP